jgi:hypothetical protein
MKPRMLLLLANLALIAAWVGWLRGDSWSDGHF